MPDLVFDMLVQDSAVLIVKGQMFAAHIPRGHPGHTDESEDIPDDVPS